MNKFKDKIGRVVVVTSELKSKGYGNFVGKITKVNGEYVETERLNETSYLEEKVIMFHESHLSLFDEYKNISEKLRNWINS